MLFGDISILAALTFSLLLDKELRDRFSVVSEKKESRRAGESKQF